MKIKSSGTFDKNFPISNQSGYTKKPLKEAFKGFYFITKRQIL